MRFRLPNKQRRGRADVDSPNVHLGQVRDESTNPDDAPLPPAAQSQPSPSSSLSSSTETATTADTAFKPTALSPQTTIGIVIIIALVLVFSLAGAAVVCGLRGERCCCRVRRRSKKQLKRERIVQFNVSDHSLPVKESREILLPRSNTP